MTFRWLIDRFNKHTCGNVYPHTILMGDKAFEAFHDLCMKRDKVPLLRFKNAVIIHASPGADPWSVTFIGGAITYRARRER